MYQFTSKYLIDFDLQIERKKTRGSYGRTIVDVKSDTESVSTMKGGSSPSLSFPTNLTNTGISNGVWYKKKALNEANQVFTNFKKNLWYYIVLIASHRLESFSAQAFR